MLDAPDAREKQSKASVTRRDGSLLQSLAHLSQLVVAGVAVVGYFYTVKPAFEREEMLRQVASAERRLAGTTARLNAIDAQVARFELAALVSSHIRGNSFIDLEPGSTYAELVEEVRAEWKSPPEIADEALEWTMELDWVPASPDAVADLREYIRKSDASCGNADEALLFIGMKEEDVGPYALTLEQHKQFSNEVWDQAADCFDIARAEVDQFAVDYRLAAKHSMAE